MALRTGNFRVDQNVHSAMSVTGIRIGSKIGIALNLPSAREAEAVGGRRWFGDVLELPVLTYTQLKFGRQRLRRLLAVTSTSWLEIKSLLWQARRHGISPIVVLTHPFEFAKGSWNPLRLSPNRINQGRLRHLCRFIAEHPDDFRSCTFSSGAPQWLQAGNQSCPQLTVPLPYAAARMAVNKCNDLFMFM
jgi:hypothetical protein